MPENGITLLGSSPLTLPLIKLPVLPEKNNSNHRFVLYSESSYNDPKQTRRCLDETSRNNADTGSVASFGLCSRSSDG